jgi:hypothetical protein
MIGKELVEIGKKVKELTKDAKALEKENAELWKMLTYCRELLENVSWAEEVDTAGDKKLIKTWEMILDHRHEGEVDTPEFVEVEFLGEDWAEQGELE